MPSSPSNPLDERLAALDPEILGGIRRGIEKESLRVTRDGRLATTPHPRGLGSALTHPHITTDFSESQLELITGVHARADACLEELTQIHQEVYRHLGDEVLWCASMPCGLPSDDEIPIGRYGVSNAGRVKTVYRVGLAHRYGRRMQTISGIHYNFSLPDSFWAALRRERSDGYFALIRNFRRHAWLAVYLLGASPAVCASFAGAQVSGLRPLGADTLHAPHATSLRMGRLGYQSDAQAALDVRYDSLEHYTEDLASALRTPYAAYEAIGLRDGDDYRQLATGLLQLENEFYATIRPKRSVGLGERPLLGLRARGVEYVEVRTIDLDPFSAIGIDGTAIRFLDVLLLYCALADSPSETPQDRAAIARNLRLVAERGREPGLELEERGRAVALAEWAMRVLDGCVPIADALDAHVGPGHADALAFARRTLGAPATLMSARVLQAMEREHGGSYPGFALARSIRHARALTAVPLAPLVEQRFAGIAQAALVRQREIENDDAVPFEDYRRQYVVNGLDPFPASGEGGTGRPAG